MEENSTSAADHAPAVRLGASLREARIRAGLSVADAAAQIRLSSRQIEALEAEDFQNLPELPFLRGFVRSYAKLLQIDAEPLLLTLPDLHPVSARIEPASVEVPFNTRQLSARQNRIWLAASVLVLGGVVALALWQFNSPRVAKEAPRSTAQPLTLPAFASAVIADSGVAVPEETPDAPVSAPVDDSPVRQQVDAPPVSVAPAAEAPRAAEKIADKAVVPKAAEPVTVAAPSAKAGKYRLVFSGESWVEIKDAEGKILYSQVFTAGSELNLSGRTTYEAVIGHARQVQVFRRGKELPMQPYINSRSEVARLKLE